jgi:hypothetical protein
MSIKILPTVLCLLAVLNIRNCQEIIDEEFENESQRIASEKIDRFMDVGVKQSEIEYDIQTFMNMFKWRYTNILPVNFRHEFLINITNVVLENVDEDIDYIISKDKNENLPKNLKENMEKIFVSRFWFSNMAMFNEIKRYFKLEIRDISDEDFADKFIDLSNNLTKIASKDENHLINSDNFDVMNEIMDLIEVIQNDIWHEYNILVT